MFRVLVLISKIMDDSVKGYATFKSILNKL